MHKPCFARRIAVRFLTMCAIFRNGRAIKEKGENSQKRRRESSKPGIQGGLESGVKSALRGPGEKIQVKEEI